MKNQIATLLEWRRQLQSSATSPAQHEAVRLQVIKLIESRRQMDEAFSVPRTEGNDIATVANSSITELHDKHKKMEQRMQVRVSPRSTSEWKQTLALNELIGSSVRAQ